MWMRIISKIQFGGKNCGEINPSRPHQEQIKERNTVFADCVGSHMLLASPRSTNGRGDDSRWGDGGSWKRIGKV
jgi:hypothetical protein